MNKSNGELNQVIASLMVEAVESDEAIDDLLLLCEIRKVCLICLLPLTVYYLYS